MRKYLILLILLTVTLVISGQGVVKTGRNTATGQGFVDKNGQTGTVPALTRYGQEIRNNFTISVVTIPPTEISSETANSGGVVLITGTVIMNDRGICWSTSPVPTISDHIISANPLPGMVVTTISGLAPGTHYYVRAYAITSDGTTYYGNEIDFITMIQPANCGMVTDADGNVYNTVTIGTQCWLQENLKTTRYNDGTPVALITDPLNWGILTSPAYCWYNNDETAFKQIYGALYNWYTVDSKSNGGKNVCPSGWHVPADYEWTKLTDYLGGLVTAGGKLKEDGTTHWIFPNTGTNESGFSALPGGYRTYDGQRFYESGSQGYWWSSTEYSGTNVFQRSMVNSNDGVSTYDVLKQNGYSIRCLKDDRPIVITTEVTNITTVSALSGGDITSDGGASVMARGVCWSTSPNPTITDNLTSDGSGIGSFTSIITGLSAGTTYYVRAYASNSTGVAYGQEIIFQTASSDPPTLITTSMECYTVNSTSVSTGGIITSDGGTTIVSRGVCWSTSSGPLISDNSTSDGTGLGSFISIITGLMPGTTYYIRAYASNSAWTSYGNEVSITTSPVFPDCGNITDIDGNTYGSVVIGTQCWMAGNLKTTRYRNGDQIPYVTDDNEWTGLTSGAYAWYNNDAATYKADYGSLYNWYTISDSRNLCPAGWHVPSDLDWTTLVTHLGGHYIAGGKMKEPCLTHWIAPNTGATNSSGFTGLPAGGKYPFYSQMGINGYWWSSTDATNNYAIINYIGYADENIDWGNNIPKYWGYSVRCLSDEIISDPALPVVITITPSNIGHYSAESGGTISTDGGLPIIARGVIWSTVPAPGLVNYSSSDGTGTGTYTSTVYGLAMGTTYYVRAYATNSAGTSYGNEFTFTTTSPGCGTVTDIDGNEYNTVTIGTQCWLQENLKTTRYNDGTPIPLVTDGIEWSNLTSSGYSWYDNNETANKNLYGALYNWFVVDALNSLGKNVCPSGWHVPTDGEWSLLSGYLGPDAGGKMKEAGMEHWQSPNSGATNESGFTALPGGNHSAYGSFFDLGQFGQWWSFPVNSVMSPYIPQLEYNVSSFNGTSYNKQTGFSIRCLKDVLPIINTYEAGNVSLTSATTGGYVLSEGFDPVVVKGVCWSTSPNPTITDNLTSDGIGIGSFTSNITGLTAGTTYYVRAYATNSVGTAYGNEVTFITAADLPVFAATSIICSTAATASVNSDITSDGGSAITTRGVCWSTTSGPTTANNKTSDGTGTGAFVSEVTGLTGGTTYYLRTYAINGTGTSYGAEVSFTTVAAFFPSCGTVTDIDGNIYNTVTIGSQCWMSENLKTTKYQNGDPIPNVTDNSAWSVLTSGAYSWYNNDAGSYKADYGALYNWYAAADIRNVCPSGWHVPSDMEWTTLTTFLGGESIAGGKLIETCFSHWSSPNTGSTNSSGFTALPGGYRSVEGLYYTGTSSGGYFWSSAEYFPFSGWSRGLLVNNINIIREGSSKIFGFSVRCVQGEAVKIPTLTATTATSITESAAFSGGSIASDGGAPVTTRGVCWSTNPGPTTANNTTSDGSGTGNFVSSITGLTPGTTYYVRAYATNSAGTAYGNEITFTTIDLSAGLFAWYPFNGNAIDETGNKHDGTVYGAQLSSDWFGNPSVAYNFNGANDDYIEVGNWNLPDTISISMSFIVRSQVPNTCGPMLFSKYDDVGGSLRSLYLDVPYDGTNYFLRMAIGPDGTQLNNVEGTTPILFNQWYHVVFVYNGSNNGKIYLNGVLEAERNDIPTTGFFKSSIPVMFGRQYNGYCANPYNSFDGQLDNIRIYRRVLSDYEIKALYDLR